MSWRSSVLEAPSRLRLSRDSGAASPRGARAPRPQRAERPRRPTERVSTLFERAARTLVHTVRRSQGSVLRRRACLFRPRRSLAGLISGLTFVALLAGMPTAGADTAAGTAGGDFTLQSVEGPVSLDDHRGKVVLLFFGYTSCPDICPLSLLRIGNCLSSLEEEQAERVSALFITLDPGRDTVERMAQYAGFFHPGIVGLTGGAEAIDDVTARYGITWERKTAPASALGYSIAHPDTILLVDADGTLAGEVRGEDGGEALRARVLELLARRG